MNITSARVTIETATVKMTKIVGRGEYRPFIGSLGVYLFVSDPNKRFELILANGNRDGQDADQIGTQDILRIQVVPLGDIPEGTRVRCDTPVTGQSGEIGDEWLYTTNARESLLPGAFKVFRFTVGVRGLSSPYDITEGTDPFGFPDSEWRSLLSAADAGFPFTALNFFGTSYGWAVPLGVATVGGSAGGSGIMPDWGARAHHGLALLMADMSMDRNTIIVTGNDGKPSFVPERTSMVFEKTNKATWVPFELEHVVDPWYSTWGPKLASDVGEPVLTVPDDGQHWCRAFGPALSAFERFNDQPSLLYCIGLAQNAMSAWRHSRLRQMTIGPKGSLGREFGWVTHFMGTFLKLIQKSIDEHPLAQPAANFATATFVRELANWCAGAAAVYQQQQLPCGAFQALRYPSPGMAPDPWEVDHVPTTAVLAQGIEHAILTVGAWSLARALESRAMFDLVKRAVEVYRQINNVGAHWIQVGTIDPFHVTTFASVAYGRPEGQPNATNVPWAIACGAAVGLDWAKVDLAQWLITWPVSVARPDMYFCHRIKQGAY